MGQPRPSLACPACGAPMNCHAEKILDRGLPSPAGGDDGRLEEVHTCPQCLTTATRPSPPDSAFFSGPPSRSAD